MVAPFFMIYLGLNLPSSSYLLMPLTLVMVLLAGPLVFWGVEEWAGIRGNHGA